MAPNATSSPRHRPLSGPLLAPLVVAGLFVVSLLQHPGSTTFDTKLDLVVDPTAFLLNALQPWTPQMNLGSLQNQASGYLFPIGPFFVLGEALHVPEWLWQRVWSGLVLAAAFEGMRRLARVWLTIGPRTAVVAGLAYALAPRVLTTVGVLSGETLPGAVLPWTVLPLVVAARGGMPWLRAAVLSAATVPFMGGQNATEVIAILPLPFAVILLAGRWSRARVGVAMAWSALVAAATLWWVGPLLVLGRHAPPFLDFIESSEITTRGVGWLEAARGVTHWVAYLPVGTSHWQAGWDLVYRPVLVVATSFVAALGLVGLTSRRLGDRRVLIFSLVLGLAVLTLGHGGPAGSPLWESYRALLDGAGAPFRNIHKSDPLVRVPLALGLALALPGLDRWGNRQGVRWWRPWLDGWVPALRGRGGVLARAVAVGLLAVTALPAASGSLRADDGWSKVPDSWQRMGQVLRDLPSSSRVLVVPAATSVAQVWGRTVDEPVQAVDGVAWASRSQIPLTPVGGLRLLDAVEQRLASGQPSDGLVPLLRRAGVSHVLVRTDLVPIPGEPSAERVSSAVERSPGLDEVQRFGRGPNGLAQVTLYAVSSPPPLVAAAPLERAVAFTGSTEDLLSLVDARAIGPGDPLVRRPGTSSAGLVTDSPKRRERSFGRIHDATSEVLTADTPWSSSRPRHDFTPVEGADLVPSTHPEVTSVRASSSASSIGVLGPLRPDEQPWAALDGDYGTHWATAPLTAAGGQWWEVEFAEQRVLGPITVVFDPLGADVSRIRVTTDRGGVSARVGADGIARITSLGRAATSHVRITVVTARGGDSTQVRMAEVIGLPVNGPPSLLVTRPVGGDTTIHLTTNPGRRACVPTSVGPKCDVLASRPPEEAHGLSRLVSFTGSGRWSVSARATAIGGAAVDALFRPVGRGMTASASSVVGSDPLVGAAAAVDGDASTAWVAAAGDPEPFLTLSWPTQRTLSRVALLRGDGVPGGLPTVQSVEVDGDTVPTTVKGPFVELGDGVRGRTLTLRLAPRSTVSGIAEVDVAGLEDLVIRVDPAAMSGTPCGFGPRLVVGDQTVQTRLSGPLGDIRSGAEIDVIPCGGAFRLGPGDAVVTAEPVAGFAVQSITLTPVSEAADVDVADWRDVAAPDVTVASWGPDRREMLVGDGGAALLRVAENANDGWVATSGDTVLEPVLVDGWSQGWVVPAGSDRRVVLSYEPATFFRATLFIGLSLGALLLLAAAFLLTRPTPEVAPRLAVPDQARRQSVLGSGLFLAVAGGVVMGPVWALGAVVGFALPARSTSLSRTLIVVCAVVAAVWRVVIGGPGGWQAGPDVVMAVAVGLTIGLCLRNGVRGRLPHASQH